MGWAGSTASASVGLGGPARADITEGQAVRIRVSFVKASIASSQQQSASSKLPRGPVNPMIARKLTGKDTGKVAF